jgi:hypothetical protein
MTRRRTLLIWGLAAIVIFLLALGTLDSHRVNARYIGWKIGLVPFEHSRCFKYIHLDTPFWRSLHGRPLAELGKWFPEWHHSSEGTPYQKRYGEIMQPEQLLWIGDSSWAITVTNGMVESIGIVK